MRRVGNMHTALPSPSTLPPLPDGAVGGIAPSAPAPIGLTQTPALHQSLPPAFSRCVIGQALSCLLRALLGVRCCPCCQTARMGWARKLR